MKSQVLKFKIAIALLLIVSVASAQLTVRSPAYVACFCKSMAAAAASYPSGATHYWAMEQANGLTRTDSVGSLNLTDGAAAWERGTGKNNFCAEGGASDILESSSFQLGTEFSIVFWFKATVSCVTITLMYHNPATGDTYLSYNTDSTMSLTVNDASVVTSTTASSDSWNLVVATFASGTASISINGSAFETASGTHLNDSGALQIGDQFEGNSFSIDEVALFTRALTITEVGNIYNSGTGRFGP